MSNLQIRIRDYWSGLNLAERATVCLAVLVVAVGIWLRARGMWFQVVPLWVDETFWGNRVVRGNISEFELRPLGFMLVTHWLVKALGYYECNIRFLPWLSSVLALFVACTLSKNLLRSLGVRVLLIAAIALHPAAIDLAREFKPYGIAFFLHLGMATFALRYLQTRTLNWLIGTLGFCLLGVFFSQDVVLAFPGIYLALAIQSLRERRRRDFLVIVAAALITLTVLGLHYWFFWRHLIGKDSGAEEFWGEKYKVFFTGTGLRERFDWWLGAYQNQASMPGLRSRDWPRGIARDWSREFWIGLHCLGLLRLAVSRRGNELLLLGLPLVMQTVFNALGYWPLGSFRTCFFALAYLLPIACIALDWPVFNRRWSAVPALLIVVLPLLVYERSWNRWKTYYSVSTAVPQVARKLLALQGQDYEGGPEPLMLERMIWSPWTYYTENRPNHQVLEAQLVPRFELHRNRARNHILKEAEELLMGGAPRVWVVLDRPNDRRPKVSRNVKILADFWVGEHTARILLLGLR